MLEGDIAFLVRTANNSETLFQLLQPPICVMVVKVTDWSWVGVSEDSEFYTGALSHVTLETEESAAFFKTKSWFRINKAAQTSLNA